MTVAEEKLAGVDQALVELGKSDQEICELLERFVRAERLDLQTVDDELAGLSEGVSIERTPADAQAAQTRGPDASEEDWDDEHTEVEIIDESDFVLLVDEDDLEEFEKVGEDDGRVAAPPAIPRDSEEDEEGDGFFKKLFTGRRTSNRP